MNDELITAEEKENLRKIFDTPIKDDDDLIALFKLCNEETKEL